MKTNLLLLKSSLLRTSGVFKAAFLLLVLLLIGTATRAQVVYSMGEPGNTSAAIAGDLIKKMNYDGTNVSTVITGANAGLIQPFAVALDGNNNRIFVSEGNLSGNVIKVITGSSVTSTITSANSAYIKDINYDVVGNWLYYITEGGDITQVTANDALYRVHPDGTGLQTLATSITKNPYRLEVDAANNKVYVVDVSFSGRSIKTVDLANSNAVTSRAFATSLNSVYDVALDKVTGYLYYCAEGGSAATLSATDQVRRQNIDGTNDVQIAASVCNSPFRLGLDAGNNRLYVGDAYYGTGKIVAINLTNNTFSTTLNFTTGQNTPQIYDFGVPDRPTVTTAAASSVVATSATLGGTLVYGYGLSTERGVVYSSTNSTPTVSDTKAANATVTTNGAYSASVTGLSASTTYYARAYAINGAGTTYGSVVSFSTPSNDANLSAFNISSGTLNPTFAAGTITYTASVTNATSTITVTPTINQANATVKVNGTAVASGSASGNISLGIGANTVTTIVTAQDGTTTKTYTLTVNRPKAAQTITFASTNSKTYGDADFAPGGSASSSLTVSYASSNTAVATIVSGQIHIVGAGTANITASQAGNASYLAATDVVQVLTVNKASQTITFGALPAKTYGNADFAPGATVGNGLTVTYASDNTAVATIVSNQVHIVGQGTANITASQTGNTNYNAAANVVQSLTVNKANLTITAAAKTKVYGDSDPAFTYTATGVVGSDAPTGALSRVLPNENKFIGTYTIDQSTLSYGSNYNVTYVGANLTINKRPVTVLPVGKTKVYGEADPFLNQFQIIAGSLAPGDATGDQFGRAPGENVGTYLMTLGTKKFYSNGSSGLIEITSNYDVTVQTAYVTITAKPVTVTASAQTKTYGDADPALTYNTSTGLAFSDTFTGSLTRAPGESFGTYAINQGTLALTSNYALTYAGANLTIGKKTINVTAAAKNKTYGDTDPALTYTADALVSGDSFTGAISRAAGETYGTYAISQNTLALNSNYTLSFTGANFTIDKKAINVTAVANSKTFGDTDPALTYTADALVSGDTYSGNVERSTGETAGDYAIGQGTLAVSNAGSYTLNYSPANFTINKRTIDINTLSQDVQFGNPDPGIGYSYTGTLASGDVLSGSPDRTSGTAVGSYATTLGTLAITNGASYDLIFHSAPYNIIQREVVVSGGSTIKIYGDADPAINYSIVSGSLLGGTTITGALARDAGETAGPYNVTQGTLAINDSNYKLTFQGGYFEVDRAPLTFTIDNKTKVATKPNPALTYSVSGFKNGDTEATAFTSAIQLTTDATINSGAGDYNIYPIGSVTAINYNITQVGGTMTVTPASSINTLASATLNGGGFNEPFDPATDFYTVSTPNGVTSATLIATVTDPLSTMAIGAYPAVAVPIASGTPYTINFTNNNTEQVGVHVTAEDGSIKSYYFNVSPIPSDSKLSNLVTSVGIISPSFNPDIRTYNLDVSAETDSVTITPTTHDPLATARVSGGEGGSTGPKKVALFEGTNVKSISAKSEDGTSTTLYSLVIKRPIRLKTLTLSAGNLSPAFDPNVTSYVAKVDLNIPAITVTPMGNKTYYQMLVNGDYVNYGDASAPITIAEDGSTTIAVKITAGDGETSKTYTINVQHASTDATLAGIALSTGSLNPAFNGADTTYNVYLPNATTSVSFTPAATETNATVKVNNAPLAAGASVTNSSLTVGVHNYYIEVTAADGVTNRTYTLSVTRAPSSEAGLSNILVSGGTLSPVFDQMAGNSYDVAVPNEVSSIDVTPILIDTTGSMSARLNGHNITLTGGVITAPLNVGTNSVIITSVAQDGATMAVNSVQVTRAADATLSSLTLSAGTLSPGFNKNTFNYTATVANAISTITLTPTAGDALATVKVNGTISTSGVASAPVTLATGANIIPVEITGTDGSVKTYTVTVSKTGSSNAYLSKITLTPYAGLTQVSGPANLNYVASVAPSTSSVKLNLIVQEAGAVIRLNGDIIANGVDSAPVTLSNPSTVVDIQITAEDGVTVKNYKVTVNKTGSGNAFLSKVALVPYAAITQVSGTADLNYVAGVSSSASSIKLNLTAQDAGAVIRLNGDIIASGVDSAPVTLTGPATIINIRVTAEDGVTVKTYKITVNKTVSGNAYLSKVAVVPYATLTQISGPADLNYSVSVASAAGSVKLNLTAQDAGAVIRLNGAIVASGVDSAPVTLSGPITTVNIQVTAEDGVTVKTYTVTVNKTGSSNAYLSKIAILPYAALTQISGTADFNYSVSVASAVGSVKLNLTVQDVAAVIRLNGDIVTSGVDSAPVTLSGPSTVVNIQVTAEDGITVKTYKVTVNKTGSGNAYLSKVALVPYAALTRVSGPADLNYTAAVSSSASSVKLNLTAQDAGSVIRLNGNVVASGADSAPVTLTGPATTINIQVTAEDGVAVKTYKITVNKTGSSNAYLSKIIFTPLAPLTQVSGPADLNYTASVSSSTNSVKLTLITQDAGAVIRQGDTVVASGTTSSPIILSGPATVFNIRVTAEDGVTVKTYEVTLNKATPPVIAAVGKNKDQLSVLQKPEPSIDPQAIDLVVKQAVSPNGDGINDRLTIQGINAYPENTVRIMNRNGDVVYEAKGYDNESKAFDGHSSKGTLQQAGTYFYSVEYKKGTETKRKTGYIVVKY